MSYEYDVIFIGLGPAVMAVSVTAVELIFEPGPPHSVLRTVQEGLG